MRSRQKWLAIRRVIYLFTGMDRHTLSQPTDWVELYGDYLFRYALVRIRDSHIAEDLLQETFLGALESRSKFAGDSSERYWLLGILKHKIADHYRKSNRQEVEEHQPSMPDDWNTSFDESGHWIRDPWGPQAWTMDPGATLERKQFWQALTRCLEELPSRQANTYTLREIEGLKSREVCTKMNVSEGNLYVMLYRVRLHLRRCLEIRWQGRRSERG